MVIKIIGTSHLDKSEDIIKLVQDFSPDILGCELCDTRFKIFTGQTKQGSGADSSLMGQIADEIKAKADASGLDYGSDQKAVMFLAINNNIPLFLLDRDILLTRSAMANIPISEMAFLQSELVKFQQESIQKEVDEEEVLESMRKNIPVAYKILVEDRDNYILKRIKEVSNSFPDKKFLIFLGKGHTKKISKELGL